MAMVMMMRSRNDGINYNELMFQSDLDLKILKPGGL